MTKDFFSYASNFSAGQDSPVDLRTGQFRFSITLVSLVGNNRLGPELDINLRYNPLIPSDAGLGYGFQLNFTRFDTESNLLELSNGERYPVEPHTDHVLGHRLLNFRFAFTNGANNRDGYTVYWKDGRIEKLQAHKSPGHFVATHMISSLGHALTLEWDDKTTLMPLRIRDKCATLFETADEGVPAARIWPGSDEEYKIRFETARDGDETLLHRICWQASVGQALDWSFGYDAVRGCDRKLLTQCSHPGGLVEKVEYSYYDGLVFPGQSGLDRLPVVVSCTRIPGSGQSKTQRHYQYSPRNFLGYMGDFGPWSANRDYICGTLGDYTYSSTETVTEGETTVTILREYSNYHLQIREVMSRNGNAYSTDFMYYAEKGKSLDAQPRQFQLLKEKKKTWTDASGKIFTQSTRTEFDEYGNPLREETPIIDGLEHGVITVTSWYPPEGAHGMCPAEPNGFVRFMKQQTVTPMKTGYDTPDTRLEYTYTRLGDTSCIVQKYQMEYRGGKIRHIQAVSYNKDANSDEFGRITAIKDTKYEGETVYRIFITGLDITTQVKDRVIEQKATVTTGTDYCKSTTSSSHSTLSGLLLHTVNPQGVKTGYVYDRLGRLVQRKDAEGSPYERTTCWSYVFEAGGLKAVQTDAAGNQTKARFDGAGRMIRQQAFDADVTRQWYETYTRRFNAFGDMNTEAGMDWLMAPSTIAEHFSKQPAVHYDNWGEIQSKSFSDGIRDICEKDPLNHTQKDYRIGRKGTVTLESGRIFTSYDKRSQLPLQQVLLHATGQTMALRKYAWDGLGRLRKMTDERGNVTERSYDVYGRVLDETLPDGTVISRTYALHLTGEQVASIRVTGLDSMGRKRNRLLGTQTFDGLGRLIRRTSGGRTTTYAYEGAAPVPARVTLPCGENVEYRYIPELGNAVSSVTADGVTRTFTYDHKTGEMMQAVEGAIINTCNRVKSGRLESEVFDNGHSQRHARYTWTQNGMPLTYTDATDKQTACEYNGFDIMDRISDDSLTLTVDYDALGRLLSRTVRDVNSLETLTTELKYDDFGREITRTVHDSNGTTLKVTQDWLENSLLWYRNTEKDGVHIRQERYYYDKRNRLTGYVALGRELPQDAYGHAITRQNYTYDALNNITSVITTLADNSKDTATYSYDNSNDPTQLTYVTHSHPGYPGSILLRYDKNGRMICDEAGRTLSYNVTGRLTGITSSNGACASYHYDAMERLVSQNIHDSETHELYYRHDRLVNDIAMQNSKQAKEQRLIKLDRTCLGVSDGKKLALIATDQNNTPLWSRLCTEDTGSLHSYSPYGQGTLDTSLPGFNGERADPVTGCYHLGNGYRAYNPVLMRFNCPDDLSPFGPGGINPYAYCGGDPVNYTDPTGHMSWWAVAGITLGVIGLIVTAGVAGAAILAAGGVAAAFSAASGATLAIGAFGVVSDITAIASGVMEDSNPELSGKLGAVSFATGVVGIGAGAFRIARYVNKFRKMKYEAKTGMDFVLRDNRMGELMINDSSMDLSLPNTLSHKRYYNTAGDYVQVTGRETRTHATRFNFFRDETGYISNFAETGEPALKAHGTKSNAMILFEGKTTRRAKGRKVFYLGMRNLANDLRDRYDIDLFEDQGTRLHLLTCFAVGEGGMAQRLADAIGRDVVAYGRVGEKISSKSANLLTMLRKREVAINLEQRFGSVVYSPRLLEQ